MTRPACTVRLQDRSVDLAPGGSLTFGRATAAETGADTSDHDETHLVISTSSQVHSRCGRVSVDEHGWTLENTGRWLHLRVSPVDRGDRVDVEPGRSLRVPWPEVRVEVLTGDDLAVFEVSCPSLAGSVADVAPTAGGTVGGLGLDREAGYFLAAVALCQPRLRDPSSTEVATVAQVARTLTRAGSERVSVKAAERRLAHLRSRLNIGGDGQGESAAGLEARDASRQLVELLLRTSTVTVADLALIEPAELASDHTDGPSS